MSFSEAEVVASIRIVKDLTTKYPKLQTLFHQDSVDISSELDNAIKEHDRLKLAWHAEVADTKPVIVKAKDALLNTKIC